MMRLVRLRIGEARHLRGLELTLRSPGLTIIHGPNEAGKSTIVACLRLLLATPSTSRHREVQALAGPSGGVEVGAVFALDDTTVELTKRWLTRPLTQLVIAGAGQLDGREAETRFAELLTAAGLGEGAGDPLVSTLIDNGAGTTHLAASRIVAEALERRSGEEALVDPGLLARARTELARYETPGRSQPTGDLRQALDEFERTESAYLVATADVNAVAEARRDLETIAEQLATLPDDEARLKAEQDERLRRRAELEGLDVEVERSSRRVADLSDAITREREALERQRELASALARSRERIEQLDRDLEERREQLTGVQAHLGASHDGLDQARRELGELRETQARAREREALASVAAGAERLSAQVARAVELRNRIAALEIAPPRRLDDALVASLQEAEARLLATRTVFETVGPSLTIRSERSVEVVVNGDLERLEPAHALVRPIDERIVVSLGDVTMEISPGSAVSELEELAAERTRLLASLGVASLDEARALLEKAAQYDHELDQLRRELANLAPDGIEPLDDEAARARAAASRLDDAPELAPSDELERRVRALSDHVEALEAAAEEAQVAERRYHEDLEQLVGAREREALQLEQAERDLATEPVESDRVARIEDLERELETERHRHRELTDAIETRNRLDEELEVLATELGGLSNRRAELTTQRHRLEERLERATGLADRVVDLEERLEGLRRRVAVLEGQRAAARRLVEVLEKEQRRARERTEAPYRQLVERILTATLGERVEVILDERLGVESLRRPTSSRTALATTPIAALSAGTREQVELACRFAATQLTGAVPIVLDDALGYSDTTRTRMLVAQLTALATDAQAIVLTAHPERYLGASDAERIDLARSTESSSDTARGTSPPPTGAASEASLEDAVRSVLGDAGGPLNRNDIASRLDADPDAVARAIRTLRDAGVIEQIGQRRGARYRLCERDRTDPHAT